jgi:hypothetical protein
MVKVEKRFKEELEETNKVWQLQTEVKKDLTFRKVEKI